MTERVPVTLVTGWQGALTAVVIDHLVRSMDTQRVAVVGSGLAAGSSAPAFFVETEPEVSERSAGCSCCALRSDLVRIVGNLSGRNSPPDWILVEAAGWTDPVLIAQTFHTDPGLDRSVRLDGIVTVVDGPSSGARLLSGLVGWPDQIASDQVAVADRIVVSGAGAMTSAARAETVAAAGASNQLAEVVTSYDDQVPTGELLGLDAFGPGGASRAEGRTCRSASGSFGKSQAVLIEATGVLDKSRFDDWISALHKAADRRLLRLEGVVAMGGADRQVVCQGIGNVLNRWRGRRFAPGEARMSRLLVAGRNLDADELQASLADCVTT